MNKVDLIGYACGWGAKVRQCKDGPLALRIMDLSEHLNKEGVSSHWENIIRSDIELAVGQLRDPLPVIVDYCNSIYNQTRNALKSGLFPVLLGGDHSMAIGTWSAVFEHIHKKGPLGLIWIDAHMDSHTAETSHSGMYHGMPLSYLLGFGNDKLAAIGSKKSKLKPEHVCLVGVRSYEEEEVNFLQDLGVKIFFMKDIRQQGLDSVMQQAVSIATHETAGFGLTIDLDVFDPSAAPGVGSPEFGGLLRDETLDSVHGLALHPKIKAIEIAEFNPHRDEENKTANLIKDMLAVMFDQKNKNKAS